MIWN